MTLYMLFAGIGILIYADVAFSEAAVSGLSSARIAFGLQVGFLASLIAATREPGDAPVTLPNGSQATMVGGEAGRAPAVGRMLFQERGCVACHRPDATSVGPTSFGLFGSPVQDPACGVAIVDESYLREAIENPSATVAVGFTPVMPTFQVTEEELQALVEYVKSLSVRR